MASWSKRIRSLHSSMISFVLSVIRSSLWTLVDDEAGQALDAVDEAQGVARRVGSVVVVEVDVDVAAAGEPFGDPRRPPVELAVTVAAAVELGRAVQPHVGE